MADDPIRAALKRHGILIDQTVTRFLSDLDATVARAQAVLQNQLLRLLKFDEQHRVKLIPANIRVLRRLPLLWQQALDDAGLPVIVQRYMDSFPSQIPAFHEILQAINATAKEPLPLPKFTADDYNVFHALKLSAGADISTLVENSAAAIITRTAWGVGAIKFHQLSEQITKATGASIGRAETLANTGLQSFYRVVSWTGYDKIQEVVKKPLLFKYVNVLDNVTRPWCRNMVLRNKAHTKAEIMAMDNGTDLPVWSCGGGYGCRGTFLLTPVPSVA